MNYKNKKFDFKDIKINIIAEDHGVYDIVYDYNTLIFIEPNKENYSYKVNKYAIQRLEEEENKPGKLALFHSIYILNS